VSVRRKLGHLLEVPCKAGYIGACEIVDVSVRSKLGHLLEVPGKVRYIGACEIVDVSVRRKLGHLLEVPCKAGYIGACEIVDIIQGFETAPSSSAFKRGLIVSYTGASTSESPKAYFCSQGQCRFP
jgi:hypothetical protein